jgi:uncharacterized protein (DUF4415 family)
MAFFAFAAEFFGLDADVWAAQCARGVGGQTRIHAALRASLKLAGRV